jgi:hypothetical protein
MSVEKRVVRIIFCPKREYYNHVNGLRLGLQTAATNKTTLHSQVIHEHGETRWNRGKTHPLELSGNPTSSHQVAKEEELVK